MVYKTCAVYNVCVSNGEGVPFLCRMRPCTFLNLRPLSPGFPWVGWMGSADPCLHEGRNEERNGVTPFHSEQAASGGTSWFFGGHRFGFS